MRKSVLCLALLVAVGCDNGSQMSFDGNYSGGRFNDFEETPFVPVAEKPVSTFSIDADGASYVIARQILSHNILPEKAVIRVEEFINYFPLDYANSNDENTIAVNGEVAECPWASGHKLIRIGVKGNDIPVDQLPPSNLVFLIDVSGSMQGEDRLELLQKAFSMLVDHLGPNDRVAIVTYAGNAGLALPATSGSDKSKIKNVLENLNAGGSTAGADGINTAYDIAKQNFITGGNNRVIMATDGDFNVGVSNTDDLLKLIESKRDQGIFLTAVGVGLDNVNDAMMERVSDHGNGTYEYISDIDQAKKVFVDEYTKFYSAGKDIKIQVAFNENIVRAYRLIGYENRLLTNQDFKNDSTDAGDIGVGQNVTALYEIVPKDNPLARVEPTFTIDFRYKHPSENESIPLSLDIMDEGKTFAESSEHMRFVASVASFGMQVRKSKFAGTATYDNVIEWSSGAKSFDPHGRRSAFIELVQKAKEL